MAGYKAYPKRYAREIYNNLAVVHGQRRVNRQINSCAQCGLCAAVCPNKADMGAFCAEARKEMTATRRMPPSAHEFALEDMIFSNAPDLAFFRHQPGKSASAWAFFPGCQLPASMPEQTKELYDYLCATLPGRSGGVASAADQDDGAVRPGQDGVGLLLRCCGAPARWSGRPALTRSAAADLRAAWEEAGRPGLIVACASCMAFFSAELPDLPVVSVWDVLADLPLPEKALPAPQTLALHDPCAARNTASTRMSVRRLLEKLAQGVEELPLGRELTRCCGYGGLADAANPSLGLAMAQSRADDSPLTMLAWCAMCRDRLRATGKESLHLLDLLFPAGEARAAALRAAPGISRRQEQRLLFSRNLLQDLWQETPPPDSAMDAIVLHIEEETARKLEARRILHSDLKKVLLNAGEQGPHFVNKETGRSLACLRPRQVTFWVEYARRPDGSYDIHDAYCHRMVVPGTPGQGLPSAATLEGYAEKGGRM
ncbi:4Fe-4S dicluster domain-containing protein [Desulfovibrio sp. OttesenSCG-928-G11]|nr:4Fe-4S dicluster domain-containing protein [Desulfovibrio sp. OttesenSCG-928-G11]